MYQQIEDFMKDKLSNLWADFRKNHSNQHCLMRMFENWKTLWTEEVIYRLYMRTIYKFVKGLWHTKQQFINCQVRGLWIWYKIPILHKNLNLPLNRKQRVHVYKNVSWAKVTAGVPQVSILGSLLFNIFVNDLFLFVSSSELSNCDDDNTLYASGYNLEEVKPVSLNDLNKVTELFFENYMVLSTGKYHFMCLGKNTENGIFIFKDTIMNNSKDENNTRCYYRQYTDF